jgi:hypothetical protein
METHTLPTSWDERWLQIIIVLLPTYLLRLEVLGLRFNVLDVVVVSCVGLYITTSWHHHNRGVLGTWKYIMGSFALIGIMAVVVSPNTAAALGLYKSYIIVPMMVGVLVLWVQPRLTVVVQAGAVLIAVLSAVGLWQFFTGIGIPAPWNVPGPEFRITSLYDYPNALGLILAPLLAIVAGYGLRPCIMSGSNNTQPCDQVSNQVPRWLIPIMILGGLMIVWSRSDGAVFALGSAVVFILLFTKWRWWALVGAVMMVCVLLLYAPTREILLFQDASGEVRLALWQGTLNLLAHHPVTGAGLAGFSELYAHYKLDRHVELLLYPHNIFLDFWVELGLLGLSWLLLVVGRTFYQALRAVAARANSAAILAVLGGVVALLVYGLVDVPYFKNDLAIVFWLLLTLSETLRR